MKVLAPINENEDAVDKKYVDDSIKNGTLTIQKNGTNVQTFTANQSTNATANITVPTKTSELTNDSGYTTNTGTITGVSVNGTSVATSGVANITSVPTNILTEPRFQSSATPTTRTLFHTVRANRLAFLPADQIIVEQSTDAGTTWTDAGWSDYMKKTLFSGLNSGGGNIPLKDGVKSTSCMLRITFSAMKYNVPEGTAETAKYNYWSSSYVKSQERYCTLHTLYFWVNANSDRIWTKLERATGANPNNWSTVFDTSSNAGRVGLTGWSGMDFITFGSSTFGGGTTQTGNHWNYRLTFRTCTATTTSDATLFDDSKLSTSSTTGAQGITGICGYGDYCWGSPNSLMSRDHLYTWDVDKNATFPADVKGTTVTSTGVLTAGSITTAGNITASSGDILLTKNATSGGQQVKWSTGENDYARVYGGATASNAGFLEIATGDDANEPIYARQYTGNFATASRTATILDASGNTSFPGALTANSIDATKLSGTIPTTCYTDTKNTAGSTDSSSKLFLVGATSQAANPQTYSQDTAYVGTDGHLYSNSKQVVNLSDTQALTNKTYNGYTLAAACAKGIVTTVDTSASLPTSVAVKTFVEGKGYTTIVPAAYCDTAARTAAKTASCTGYTLTANTYLHIIIVNANSYNGAITLNVNGKGAKPIYINEDPSGSSNKTLPAGSYICYYDGTNYYFNTDGKLPHLSGAAYTGVDTTLVQGSASTNVPTSAAVVNYINSMGYGANNVYVGTTEPISDDVQMWVNPEGMMVAKNGLYVSGAIYLEGNKLFWYE